MRASAEHEMRAGAPSEFSPAGQDSAAISSTRVRIPQHVVYRSLATETVVLNVETGIYYGLNQTAGRMLEVLERVGEVERAIPQLSEEFEVAAEVIRRDMAALCEDLEKKGLIEVHSG